MIFPRQRMIFVTPRNFVYELLLINLLLIPIFKLVVMFFLVMKCT